MLESSIGQGNNILFERKDPSQAFFAADLGFWAVLTKIERKRKKQDRFLPFLELKKTFSFPLPVAGRKPNFFPSAMDESAFQTFLKESNLMELWGSPLLFPRDGYEIEVRTLKSEYDTLALHLHLRRACLLKELDAGRFTGDEEKDFYQVREGWGVMFIFCFVFILFLCRPDFLKK